MCALIWQKQTSFDEAARNSTTANEGALSNAPEGTVGAGYRLLQDKAALAASFSGCAYELSDYFGHFRK